MIEIKINVEQNSSIESMLPPADVKDEIHAIIMENGTNKISSDFWKTILDDERLRALSLVHLQLYQSDARILADFLAQTETLQELTLDSVQIHFYAFDQILNEGLQKNSSVRRLVLTSLENVDAATIASLAQHNKFIENLVLSRSNLSSTAASIIADGLKKNSTLKHLDLSENQINNEGATAFFPILDGKNSKLVSLNLSGNQIDPQIEEKLASISKSVRVILTPENESLIIDQNKETPVETKENKEKFFYIPMILVTFLFFLWGVPNQLNDILIRQFSKSFVLSRFEAGLVQSAFYLGYFSWSLPAAYVLRRWDYKVGLIVGLTLFGTGCLCFWPAALIGEYVPFLVSLFIIATGLAFLETSANPFIAHAVGPVETSEKRLNIAQAFNPLGAITGALIGTLFIFSGIELTQEQIDEMKRQQKFDDYLKEETLRVVKPYAILGAIALIWAIMIAFTRFPKHSENKGEAVSDKNDGATSLCRPLFFFAVIAQFFYLNAQVGSWSYFIQYAQDYVQVSEKVAGYLLTGTLVMFGLGRGSAALLMHFGFTPAIILATFSMINVLLIALVILLPNIVGLICLFITSFFMSLMFPTIFALGIKGFSGHTTKLAGCILIMSIVGGAVAPPIMGLINVRSGSLALAYSLPGLAYLVIGIFALLAYSLGTKQRNKPN